MVKVFTTSSSTQTKRLAQKLAGQVREHKKPRVIGLQGDLGSGKTTFVQGFAQGSGVKEKVLSPTFVIMKKYGTLYHIDKIMLYGNGEGKGDWVLFSPKQQDMKGIKKEISTLLL